MSNVLLVRDLKIEFRVPEGVVKAVEGVSFRVPKGKTVAIVGESGSGKTVISQAIMGILPKPAHITNGEIVFFDPDKPGNFVDIAKLSPDGSAMRNLRGGRISIIFQEPMTSLTARLSWVRTEPALNWIQNRLSSMKSLLRPSHVRTTQNMVREDLTSW